VLRRGSREVLKDGGRERRAVLAPLSLSRGGLAAVPGVLGRVPWLAGPAATRFYGQRRIDAFHASFSRIAVERAVAMGVPMAMANKWGPWQTTPPGVLPRLLWPQMKTRFPGFTHIADGDGREVAPVQEGEGVALATVHLDPSRKQSAVGPEQNRFRPWIAKVPSEYGAFRYFEALGRRWYAKHSAARKATPHQPTSHGSVPSDG